MEYAVVTGAGSGIGRAVAQVLARDGYAVALLGRRAEALETTSASLAGTGHIVVPGDLTDPATVERVAQQIRTRFGAVHALVHCAGGGSPRAGTDLASLRAHLVDAIDANLVSAALLTEALEPALVEDRARVVATSSIAAFRGGGIAYASAKSAIHGWAFTLAQQLGPRGITVNVVAPGYITDTEFFGDAMTDDRHRRLVDQTDVGRAGVPDDVANTVGFLVGDGARHITGQVVQVNGGALKR